MQAYCPNYCMEGFFFLAKIWNLFLKRNCNNRRMKESYAPNYVQKIVHISALFYQSLSIISASGRQLLKMKHSKSFF